MATTKNKKRALRGPKNFGKAAGLAAIRKWRDTSGQKLKGWDEVKAIRSMRDGRK